MRPFSVSFSSKHVKLITKKFVVQIVKTECEKRSKDVGCIDWTADLYVWIVVIAMCDYYHTNLFSSAVIEYYTTECCLLSSSRIGRRFAELNYEIPYSNSCI